ncbi:MAG: hypothetical protein Q7W05_01675 [Deltaproteobacteria bacterium]|nr:hypothetical protein [Deltaproteobacteria bacterium]
MSIAVDGGKSLSACLRAGQSPSSDKPAGNEKRNARMVLCDELFSFWFFFFLATQKRKRT